jgi:aryl-alcohol dehydrogenase-like predicted oxidoreductase
LQLSNLGQTGLQTSVLAFGCARLGSTLTPLTNRQSIALLNEALDLGVRHFDTASIYGQGDSEKLIARALRARRSEFCLASKAGQRLSARQAALAYAKRPLRMLAQSIPAVRGKLLQQRAHGIRLCFHPDYIERSLESSLLRLRTDVVDIFYLHSPSALDLGRDDLWRRADQWYRDGKIRALGVSCDDLSVAEICASMPDIKIVQFDMGGGYRSTTALAAIRRNGKVAVVRGVARQYIGTHDAVRGIPAALRSTASLPGVGTIIVETSRREHLRQNVEALSLVPRNASSE